MALKLILKLFLFLNEFHNKNIISNCMKKKIIFFLIFFQLDVLLNGLGTWKGRNMLACLNVVKGEWDALLQWPSKLRADIILRNQSDDPSSV